MTKGAQIGSVPVCTLRCAWVTDHDLRGEATDLAARKSHYRRTNLIDARERIEQENQALGRGKSDQERHAIPTLRPQGGVPAVR